MSGFSYSRDVEVVQRMRPEPMTAAESAAQAVIADLDFDIFKHKMQMIALEGKETTMKLGASTAMRWGDVAFGVFTAQGDLAVCATGIFHHAVLGQIPLKYVVKHWVKEPSVGAREGDAFFYNDPFYGGVHNADMGLAIPVFHGGELVSFVGAAVHTGECGGADPVALPHARTQYEEGSRIGRSRSARTPPEGRPAEHDGGDDPRSRTMIPTSQRGWPRPGLPSGASRISSTGRAGSSSSARCAGSSR
jgi:acetophenone carboxylase